MQRDGDLCTRTPFNLDSAGRIWEVAAAQSLKMNPTQEASPKLARRLGVVGVLFFLIKGLFWLSVPLLLAVKGCAP